MGSGTFSVNSYASYTKSVGATYDYDTGRVRGQSFKSTYIDESLDPRKFTVRECANSEEHPNTIPVILALDVTGSMGEACGETAAALGIIITNLYKKFKDIEFCVMGIGDLAYDMAPVQMSQFESDVRIAEALDKIYMEKGGGGNTYESYTAAWYMGLYRTKLDAYDKQGRKGIIITMGDETLNPYLPVNRLNAAVNANEQMNVETTDLYAKASQKFDIFHISVDSPRDCFSRYKKDAESSFGQILGSHYKVSTINQLSETIESCITESIQSVSFEPVTTQPDGKKNEYINENGNVTW